MIVNVAELKAHAGRSARHRFEWPVPPFESGDDEALFPRPARVDAKLINTGKGILAEVRLKVDVTMNCGRCLEPFTFPLAVSFEQEYREGEGPAGKSGEREDEGEGEGEDVAWYEGETIDLSDAVRDNILLALPMKPLCREACAGLCPQCGANLNYGKCECRAEQVDPRLAVLKDLLPK